METKLGDFYKSSDGGSVPRIDLWRKKDRARLVLVMSSPCHPATSPTLLSSSSWPHQPNLVHHRSRLPNLTIVHSTLPPVRIVDRAHVTWTSPTIISSVPPRRFLYLPKSCHHSVYDNRPTRKQQNHTQRRGHMPELCTSCNLWLLVTFVFSTSNTNLVNKQGAIYEYNIYISPAL